MTRRIAIIPARAGSKRVPRKNVRDFCGRPMIGYILETARQSGLFDVIHVSTENDEVRDIVERLGFTVDFLRPPSLADDHTPLMPVLKYVVETYAERDVQFEEVWLLMPCAPLIEAVDLEAAARVFERWEGRRPVLPVSQYSVPIEWAFRCAGDGELTPVQPGMFAIRSQDLEPKYFDTGTFAIFPCGLVRSSEGAGSDTVYVGHLLEKTKAVDIDDESDWALAEAMFRYRQRC